MSITKYVQLDLCLSMERQHSNKMACLKPFQRKDLAKPIDIPCGKCPDCIKRRVNGWAFRLMQEEKVSESSHFITLTYDTLHVPITPGNRLTLDKKDLQLFMKRLRKTHSQKLKFYAVGEYGDKTNRPHYHMILFNARIDLIQDAWQVRKGRPYQGKPLGHIYYGDVSQGSVMYTLKYISKPRIELDPTDDRQPGFTLMSKGLGESYLTPQMIEYHKKDLENRVCHTLEDGKKVAMPRYYKNKIYNELERKKIAIHAQIRSQEEQLKFNQDKDFDKKFAARNQSHVQAYTNMYNKSKKGSKI